MAMGRPKVELVLSEDERSQLMSIARSRSISAALVARARIVLAAAGLSAFCSIPALSELMFYRRRILAPHLRALAHAPGPQSRIN
ncbi:hypothetical protein AK34_1973 [Burkholderia dolosa AU0158]|nr:hypothetical protein AK34_1973 [Burkholderia dolosa AU0158]VWB85229.1 endonuclease DDE [Burkholderia dolosa]